MKLKEIGFGCQEHEGSFLFQVHMNFTRRPWHVLCPCTFRWSQVPVWRVLAAMKSPAIPKMSCHGLRKSVEELLAQLDRDEAREWEASWWHRNGGVELGQVGRLIHADLWSELVTRWFYQQMGIDLLFHGLWMTSEVRSSKHLFYWRFQLMHGHSLGLWLWPSFKCKKSDFTWYAPFLSGKMAEHHSHTYIYILYYIHLYTLMHTYVYYNILLCYIPGIYIYNIYIYIHMYVSRIWMNYSDLMMVSVGFRESSPNGLFFFSYLQMSAWCFRIELDGPLLP